MQTSHLWLPYAGPEPACSVLPALSSSAAPAPLPAGRAAESRSIPPRTDPHSSGPDAALCEEGTPGSHVCSGSHSCRTWKPLPAARAPAPLPPLSGADPVTPTPAAPSPGQKALKCLGHIWKPDALQVTQWHSLCSCTSPVLSRQVAAA